MTCSRSAPAAAPNSSSSGRNSTWFRTDRSIARSLSAAVVAFVASAASIAAQSARRADGSRTHVRDGFGAVILVFTTFADTISARAGRRLVPPAFLGAALLRTLLSLGDDGAMGLNPDTVERTRWHQPNEDRTGFKHRTSAWVIDGVIDIYPGDRSCPPSTTSTTSSTPSTNRSRAHRGRCIGSRQTALRQSLGLGEPVESPRTWLPAGPGASACSLGRPSTTAKPWSSRASATRRSIAAGRSTTEPSTTFNNQREIAAVVVAGPQGPASRDARYALLRRRREYITGEHPEGVFSGDPGLFSGSSRTHLDWAPLRHVLAVQPTASPGPSPTTAYTRTGTTSIRRRPQRSPWPPSQKRSGEVEHHPSQRIERAPRSEVTTWQPFLREKNPEA